MCNEDKQEKQTHPACTAERGTLPAAVKRCITHIWRLLTHFHNFVARVPETRRFKCDGMEGGRGCSCWCAAPTAPAPASRCDPASGVLLNRQSPPQKSSAQRSLQHHHPSPESGGGDVMVFNIVCCSCRSRCVPLISAFVERRLIKHISSAAACRGEQSRLEITHKQPPVQRADMKRRHVRQE